jgi:penicillin-binding protein 1A
VVALVGGFDFFQSKFNRVTQARRQPGSGFKPFVYAAAFDKGFTPASVVMDAPIVIDEAGMEQAWRPKENEGKFFGPIRLREAMIHSRNLVSVRLMREIGGDYTWHYVQRFGFEKNQLPNDLTMALGTASVSPLQMATAYSTFANGGFRVTPYYIDRIEDAAGKTLLQAAPAIACPDCSRAAEAAVAASGSARATADGAPTPTLVPTSLALGSSVNAALTGGSRPGASPDSGSFDGKSSLPAAALAPQVLRPQVAYLLSDMMADVIKHGTGMGARVLNRDDIAGKTGTTNEQHDAWFNGFNGALVTTVWTGFDQDRSLGAGEEGAHAALPTWVYFMHEALAGTARHGVPVPDGIVSVRISPESGLLASSDNPNGIMEKFIEGNLPKTEVYEGPNNQNPMTDGDKPLF